MSQLPQQMINAIFHNKNKEDDCFLPVKLQNSRDIFAIHKSEMKESFFFFFLQEQKDLNNTTLLKSI